MKRISLRRNFAWSFAGTITYNLVLWLLIVALARVGSAEMVGEYALILAITAPVFMLIGLNLRVVRATDVAGRWSSATYYRLRLRLNLLSVVVSVGIGLAVGLRGELLGVLVVVALSKSMESTSLLLYGFFQVNERLDLVARSLLLRSALGGVGFVGALIATNRLLAASIGLGIGWAATFVFHDRVWERRLLASVHDVPTVRSVSEPSAGAHPGGTVGSLALKASPLGLAAGTASVATNVPRFAVQAFLGTGALGLFAALAYLSQVVSMIAGTLGDTIVGRLAKAVEAGDLASFRGLLMKLFAFGGGVAVVGAMGAHVLGEMVISTLMGPEFVNQPALVTLMLGAGAITAQRCLSRGLHAAHKFWWVMAIDVLILVLTVVASAVLVPVFGITGAAGALGLGFLGGLVVTTLLLRTVVDEMRERSP